MKIICKYGKFDSTTLLTMINDEDVKKMIENRIETANLFFVNEVQLDFDGKEKKYKENFILDILDNNIIDGEGVTRSYALIEFDSNIILTSIEQTSEFNSEFSFECETKEESQTWLILTDDEADAETVNYIESVIEDVGLFELIGDDPGILQYILNNDDLFDGDYFKDMMLEVSERYIEDIENEDINDNPEDGEYLNRLHEEMVEAGVLEEPEWPKDPDELHQAVEEIKDEIEDKKEEFAVKRDEDYKSGVEWYRDNFGDEELAEFLKNNPRLIDNRSIAIWLFKNDYTNRGNELASYDGVEQYIDVMIKGKKYKYYLYRTD